MPSDKLRFRQIHLDFHTSPHIEAIGERFDKKQWQEALRIGYVDSINLFAKCHHGWSYHETKVGKMHPHLKFDLLRAQYDACKEIGIKAPIYLSSGYDNMMAEEHPEWREVSINGHYGGWTVKTNDPGFITLCFNSPYLDYLCEQTREVAQLFPDCDGIWSDIIFQTECCCKYCMKYMEEHDLDPDKSEDRRKCADAALERYYREFTAASRIIDPDMPVFHNSGHVAKGKRDLYQFFSHMELESLPTGGWGYDHFPLSAKYVQSLGVEYLGMTGKFHTWWGEFGGYKHPNALRYECSAMLAHGAKCCVGDQLHPDGLMDPSTYRIIGAAYREVEEKEPWCRGVESVVDLALLSGESETGDRNADIGASRILFESHLLFDVIDRQMDFSPYKMLILPDVVRVDNELKVELEKYVSGGGKLLLTGESGINPEGTAFALDTGAEYVEKSPFYPDYLKPLDDIAPSFVDMPLVMYMPSQRVRPTSGEVLGEVWEPYFNRTWKHFCSHQHAPAKVKSEYAAVVRKGSLLYFAHPVFSIYHAIGAVAYKDMVVNAIKMMLGDGITLKSNLPSPARVTVTHQEEESRYILHLLYANMMSRGANTNLAATGYVRPKGQVEVVEDLLPLVDVDVELRLPREIKRVTLEPQGTELPPIVESNTIKIHLDRFTCHQMVVLSY